MSEYVVGDFAARTEAIVDEVFEAKVAGLPFAHEQLMKCPTITGLASVASSSQLENLENARQLVLRATNALDPDTRLEIVTYLGLSSSSARLNMGERIRYAAAIKRVDQKTWRQEHLKRRVLSSLASSILRIDERWRRRNALPRRIRHPLLSRLIRDWTPYLHYACHCETVSIALSGDLSRCLLARRGETQRSSSEDYLGTSLYWLAWAQHLDVQRFLQFGDSWTMTNPYDEKTAADSFYEICFRLPPFSQREYSKLRIILNADTQRELDPFLDRVLENSELISKWGVWVSDCECPSDTASRIDCRVHQLIEQVTLFSDAVRAMERDLVDYYVSDSYSPTTASSYPWAGESTT